MPSLVITIRTADRSTGDARNSMPKGRRNYLGATVRHLQAQGADLSCVHVFSSDTDRAWLDRELGGALVHTHVPTERRTPNQNALAQMSVLDSVHAEWILMLEDDLEFCADFVESVQQWIADYARPDVHVYRLFSFRNPLRTVDGAYRFPVREMVGSQAVLLRAADARHLVAWHAANRLTWRPRKAPFQKDFQRGFDKMVGYWSLAKDPTQAEAIVSRPFFVKHIGEQSSLRVNTWGLQNNRLFAGTEWSYRSSRASSEVA